MITLSLKFDKYCNDKFIDIINIYANTMLFKS